VSVVEEDGRFLPGAVVAGRYRILGMLGKGGMGEVYRATDLALAQSVALKFLNAEGADNQRWLERFHAEVRIARQISHPNVCRVYDIGEADGVPFLSMEYLDGDDVATLLVGIGKLPYDKALDASRKICAGLAAAHDKGVIHRDLKPQNIMMTRRGEILITDFGLAAVADTLRGAEARNGTPAYMSPEQLRGAEVTAKSDIYALGLVMYELFTGKKPFEAKSIPELISLQESQPPSSMKTYASEIDPAVEGIIRKCLHPDPAMRPASALAVAAALPGGDPLAAALAAGETPSPELLAASGKRTAIPARLTLPVLAAVLIFLLGMPAVVHHYYSLSYNPLDMSPEVLQQKARDNAALLGYADRPADSDFSLHVVDGYYPWLNKNRKKDRDWYAQFHAEPVFNLFYRQSPRLLISPPDGVLRASRPAQNIPGMWSMEVDSMGRLRKFEAVPPEAEDGSAPTPVDFTPSAAFRAAGFDLSKFVEAPPQAVPATPFDWRKAYKGRHPSLDNVDVTVQTAAWRGRIVDFRIEWPWTKAPAAGAGAQDGVRIFNAIFRIVLVLSGLFFCVWLGVRNVQRGRGDMRGAIRLALVYLGLQLLVIPADAHFVPDGASFNFLTYQVGMNAFYAGLVWLLYLALEPVVRARWPHSIVTWSRALTGQFRDPQLGAHILWGCGIGVLVALIFAVPAVLSFNSGVAPFTTSIDVGVGTRNWIAVAANNFASALTNGMLIIFLIFGVRQLVRKDWLAAVVVGLLLTWRQVVGADGDFVFVAPVMLATYFSLVWLLMRVGMVAVAVAVFVANTLLNNPATLDPQIWYAAPAYLRLVMIAAIATFGFVQSRGDSAPAAEV
jgi:serine/threonine-protein kinase